jgi:AhpD family alkylhydroperoxidase
LVSHKGKERWPVKDNHNGRYGDPEQTSLFVELRRVSPRVTGALLRMRQDTYRDGSVLAKYKLLTALVVAIALRCEPCIRAYVSRAHEQGVMQQELVEFLEVAMTMQGCPGEEWALKAYGLYKECVTGMKPSQHETCMPTEERYDMQQERQELNNLANSLAKAFPRLTTVEGRVVVELIRQFMDTGVPVLPTKIAQALDLQSSRVEDILAGWADWDNVYYDADHRIVAAWGLGLSKTSHRFEIDGRILYTWCALDPFIYMSTSSGGWGGLNRPVL